MANVPFTTKLRNVEINAIACCFIACSAIAMDALCALPHGMEQQVPASLRCTAMCAVACLGSPIVTRDLEIEQRSVLLILLVSSALVGEHHGQKYVRVADAIFALISGWVIILTVGLQSTNLQTRPVPGASLSGALLAYVGLRAVRAGMTHATEAYNFNAEADDFDSKGYAVGDGVVVVAITFGGSMLACTGVLIMFSSASIQERGTFVVSPMVSMNTSFVFISAFVAQLSVYAHFENISTLFSESACSGGVDDCSAAYRARRLYLTNSSPASLWIGCIAATVFSMPKQRRCQSRVDYYTTSNISTPSGLVTITVTILAAVATWGFSPRDYMLVQVEILLIFFSIPLAWFGTTFVACVFNVAGNVLFMHQRPLGSWNLDLNYFTNWSLLVTVALVSIIGLSTLLQRVLYAYDRAIITCDKGDTEFTANITGALTVALLSLQFALTLLTLSLLAGYDGALVTSFINWRTVGYEYTVQHSLTFFFSAAIYGSRYETGDLNGISSTLRKTMWYTTPLVVGAAWALTLVSQGNTHPYTQADESWGLFTGIVCAVVPWLVTGIGV